jgi:hypothetical protein
VEALKKAMDELSAAIQKVGASMYETPQPAAGQPGADQSAPQNSGPQSGTGPVDAEFKEVK